MTRLLPELIGLAGVTLIAVALWLWHPAASLGGLGVMACGLSVALYRANRKEKP